jgi:biopolymer transport protein ExbB
MNLLSLFLRGGVVMWPILFCSVVGLVILIEKYLVLRKSRVNVDEFMEKLKGILQKGDLRGAVGFCSGVNVPLANILKKALLSYDEGEAKVKEAIETAGKEEIYHLERHLAILATIAGVAPLLGFLGTVTGMISAFRVVESMAGVVSPGDLAGGIWEALLTTAFGLMVGIPAYGFYNYFVTRVQRFIFEIENSSTEFLSLMRLGKFNEGEIAIEVGKAGSSSGVSSDELVRVKAK